MPEEDSVVSQVNELPSSEFLSFDPPINEDYGDYATVQFIVLRSPPN
jgi:hypothetical protein